MFQTRFKCFKRVLNVSNTLLIHVASISNRSIDWKCPKIVLYFGAFRIDTTVADTCHMLFSSGISNAFGIQGGANIRNYF